MAGSYRRYIQYVLETCLVLCAWGTAEQDLVTGRFAPLGEAHPQLMGFPGVRGHVGVPQAACPGHRHRLQ